MDRSEKLAKARRVLAECSPAALRGPIRTMPSGLTAVDHAAGGLPLGAVTEIVCASPSSGAQSMLAQLLAVTRTARVRVALVDATDGFDPDSFSNDELAHLVWVRCPPIPQPTPKTTRITVALQVADLMARDANLGLVMLDLRHAPEIDLRRISGPQWYRFQRAVEPAELAFVVFTPRPSVPSAQVRFVLEHSLPRSVLASERPETIAHLAPALQRQRLQIFAG